MELRAPSRLEILGALAAIAEGRIKLTESNTAMVDGFIVKWNPSKDMVTSNDPVTDQGRLGYPAISMLMVQGILPYDAYLASKLKGLSWNFEKEDEVAVHEILKNWSDSDKQKVVRYTQWITDMITDLNVEIYKETLSSFVKE